MFHHFEGKNDDDFDDDVVREQRENEYPSTSRWWFF